MTKIIVHTLESIKGYCEEVGDCWEWQRSFNSAGYPQARHNGLVTSVRRIVYVLKYERIRADHVIVDTCDNPRCVNPDHMVSRHKNKHMAMINQLIPQTLVKKQRISATQRKRIGKLNEALVAEMRESTKSGRQWARELGLNQKTVQNAINGQTWKIYSTPFQGLFK